MVQVLNQWATCWNVHFKNKFDLKRGKKCFLKKSSSVVRLVRDLWIASSYTDNLTCSSQRIYIGKHNVQNAMEIGKKKHRPLGLFCEVTDSSFVDRHKNVKFIKPSSLLTDKKDLKPASDVRCGINRNPMKMLIWRGLKKKSILACASVRRLFTHYAPVLADLCPALKCFLKHVLCIEI